MRGGGVEVEHPTHVQKDRGSNPGAGRQKKSPRFGIAQEAPPLHPWGLACGLTPATIAGNALPHQSRIGHPGVVSAKNLP